MQPMNEQSYAKNSAQQTIIRRLIEKWNGWRKVSRKELYSLLSEARAEAVNDSINIKMEMIEELLELDRRIEELEKRNELLTPANVLAASRRVDDEVSQIPLKVSRTVDWRTKRQELENKYSKEKVRDSLVKEISTPADIFKE